MITKNISKLLIVIFSVFILSISSLNYSYADNHLSKKEIIIDRKILSDLAINDSSTFEKIVQIALK